MFTKPSNPAAANSSIESSTTGCCKLKSLTNCVKFWLSNSNIYNGANPEKAVNS
jgi:hypothetical protein